MGFRWFLSELCLFSQSFGPCLRQANVKKHSSPSSSIPLAVRDYLASQVLFSAALPTQTLFTLLWDEVLNSLCGRPEMQTYLSQHLLQRHATRDVWEAPWWGGLCSGLKGGFTTLTAFQALERMNRTLKSLSIQDVSERIERLCSTCCRLQGSAATEQFLRGSPMLGSPLQANDHYAAS